MLACAFMRLQLVAFRCQRPRRLPFGRAASPKQTGDNDQLGVSSAVTAARKHGLCSSMSSVRAAQASCYIGGGAVE
jgi:hypothetical protein